MSSSIPAWAPPLVDQYVQSATYLRFGGWPDHRTAAMSRAIQRAVDTGVALSDIGELLGWPLVVLEQHLAVVRAGEAPEFSRGAGLPALLFVAAIGPPARGSRLGRGAESG